MKRYWLSNPKTGKKEVMALRIKSPAHTSVGKQITLLLTLFCVILSTVVACGPKAPLPAKEGEMALSISSTAFKEGDKIPVNYTCDGQDIQSEWLEADRLTAVSFNQSRNGW